MRNPGARLPLAVTVLTVQLVSLRSLDKYVFHEPLATLAAAVVIGAICFGLAWHATSRAWAPKRTVLLLAALFVALSAVSLVVHPQADALKLVGRGSDHDDAMILGAQNLVLHFDPYYAPTYLGNALSPGPGWILLAAPFSLSGTYSLFFAFSLAALAALLAAGGAGTATILGSLIVLLGGLGIWEALSTGGDLLPLGVGLVACLVPLRRGWRSAWGLGLYCLFVALVLTGRFVLPVLVPFIGLYLARSGKRREALAFVAGTTLMTLVLHGLFYWRAAGEYMPFALLTKGLALLRVISPLDPWLSAALLAAAGAAGGLAAWRLGIAATHPRLVLASALVLTLPLSVVALADLAARGFALSEWEGSNYLLVTIPLWIYCYALGATTTEAGMTETPSVGGGDRLRP